MYYSSQEYTLGTNTLKAHEGLKNGGTARQQARGAAFAAICAAPSILWGNGTIKGKKQPPAIQVLRKLEVAYTRQGVITDGNITTARGLGYAFRSQDRTDPSADVDLSMHRW